jgi:mRNA deadenylase 3'-5' endonuclease subunit Ccr4
MGYNSFWRRKDSRGVRDIGNMILYREDVFNVLERFHWRYCDSRPTSLGLVQQALPLVQNPDALEHYRGNQLAVGLRLQHKTSGRELLLINTHICCNHQNPDAQLAQVYALTRKLESDPALSRLPIIISGDFNVMPDSPVYRFLDEGRLAGSEPILNPKEEGVPRIFPDAGISCGALGLQSAYKAGQGREPETTNVKPDFTGCLDYIWFSRQLRVTAVSPLPSLAVLRSESGGLPSSTNPSDHVPIAAQFAFSSPQAGGTGAGAAGGGAGGGGAK